MLPWLRANWLPLLQSFGIISSFLLAAYANIRNTRSRKVANYLQLTKFHREIWSMTVDDPSLNRVRSRDAALWTTQIEPAERQFLTFLFLHITCAFELAKNREILQIKGLQDDISKLLEAPMVRRYWDEQKFYFNPDFAEFINSCLSPLPLLAQQKPDSKSVESAPKTILVASAFPDKIVKTLSRFPDRFMFVQESAGKITADFIRANKIDIIISFGYGRIFRDDEIKLCRIVNLHGGFLPWNRGPNPNAWSWIDGTPKGVTVHAVDAGIDTGEIYSQRRIEMGDDETLRSSFEKVLAGLVELFDETWDDIRGERLIPVPQRKGGTSHSFKDQEPFRHLLREGMDRKMADLVREIRQVRQQATIPVGSPC